MQPLNPTHVERQILHFGLGNLRSNLQARICKLKSGSNGYILQKVFWNLFNDKNSAGDFEIPICVLVNLLRFLHSCFFVSVLQQKPQNFTF